MRTRALYAGSFDPLTNGHMDIIKRAAKLSDHLVIGILVNQDKTPMFTLEERKEMVEEALKEANIFNASVDTFSGLLTDYVLNNHINVIVRGLRCEKDFQYEFPWARQNATYLNGEAETVFLMADPKFDYVSSSSVKEVFKLGARIDKFVPRSVARRLR